MSFFKLVKNSMGMDLEAPSYTVTNKIDEFTELRKYAKGKWVCTSQKGQAQDIFQNSDCLSEKLITYISGQNAEQLKVPLTTPVTFGYIIANAEKFTGTSVCTMALRFYVPNSIAVPPKPSDNTVYIEDNPEMVVAVIRFSGYATIDDFIFQRDLLIGKLGDEAKNYDCVHMMTAGYDPPFKVLNRRNEVWLRKIDAKYMKSLMKHKSK